MSLQSWLQERQYRKAYHWHQRPNDEREYQLRTDVALDLAGLSACATRTRLLDIGCGDGRFTADAVRVAEVVGADVSRRALGLARSLVADAQFVNATAERLPFESKAFDVVMLLDVIEHIPDEHEQRVIDEARRVLRSGGRLVVSTNSDRSARELKHFRHYSLPRFRSLFEGMAPLHLRGIIPYFPTLRVWMAAPIVSRFLASRVRICSPEIAHVVVGAATKP